MFNYFKVIVKIFNAINLVCKYQCSLEIEKNPMAYQGPDRYGVFSPH